MPNRKAKIPSKRISILFKQDMLDNIDDLVDELFMTRTEFIKDAIRLYPRYKDSYEGI